MREKNAIYIRHVKKVYKVERVSCWDNACYGV